MINRNMFTYSESGEEWYHLLYSITDNQYNNIDFKTLSDMILFSENKSSLLENISQKAIMNYAKEINFFTKEEYEDLVFEYLDTVFEDRNGILESFTRTYSVNEDEETTKIFWKDVYGVWKVTFNWGDVIKVVRENS